MPKLQPRNSQLTKKIRFKTCCDADKMSNSEFKSVIDSFENCHDDCCETSFSQPATENIPVLISNTDSVPLEVETSFSKKVKIHEDDMATRMLVDLELKNLEVSP